MSTTRRRRFPWWLLLVAFVVVPLVEIYVIIQVGQLVGPWWTILLLIADSLLGSWLVKREGGRAWKALRVALEEGRLPHRELADGMLILIGGLLMLTPGFVLDAVGLLAILPFTRPAARRLLSGVIARRLVGTGAGPGFATGFGPGFGPGSAPGSAPNSGRGGPRTADPAEGTASRAADDVVRGQVVDEDRHEERPEDP